jgi:hypothetical protein
VDLLLYARVLWRFRVLVAVGTLLAIALLILSMFSVKLDGGKPSLSYRESETWRSDATLFVTQDGFPWGRVRSDTEAVTEGELVKPRFADPARFAELAVVYSELAQSDAILELMLQDGPVPGAIMAEPKTSADGDGLPLLGVSALAATPKDAVALNKRQIDAFRAYIEREQVRSEIPPKERVEVRPMAQPSDASLETPRKKTRPLAIFMAVMIATIGLAFVLENLRSRRHAEEGATLMEAPLPSPQEAALPPARVSRRSA